MLIFLYDRPSQSLPDITFAPLIEALGIECLTVQNKMASISIDITYNPRKSMILMNHLYHV